MATLFPNDPTWATFGYWNRDDVATGNFEKKVEFMIANNGEIPLYLNTKTANTPGAVFAAAGP